MYRYAEDDKADEGKNKVKSKREKARDKADKEMELHRREQALRDAGDRAPETAKEFEKLIMSSPRSSYVWLRYMAFQMSVVGLLFPLLLMFLVFFLLLQAESS